MSIPSAATTDQKDVDLEQKAVERLEKSRIATGKLREIFSEKWSKNEDIIDPYQRAVESAITKFDTVESYITTAEKETAAAAATADENSAGAKTYGDCYSEGHFQYTAAIAEEALVDLELMRIAIKEDGDATAAEAHLLIVQTILNQLVQKKNADYVSGLDQTLLNIEGIGLAKGKNCVNAAYFPAFNKTIKVLETNAEPITMVKVLETQVQKLDSNSLSYDGYVRLVAEQSLDSQQLAELRERLIQDRGNDGCFTGKLWSTHLAKISVMVGDLRAQTMNGRM